MFSCLHTINAIIAFQSCGYLGLQAYGKVKDGYYSLLLYVYLRVREFLVPFLHDGI